MFKTSHERIAAAIQGQWSERPPFALITSLYGARLTGCETQKYYRSSERYAEGQKAVVRLTDPDILTGPFALPLEAEAFGCELVFLSDNPPNIRKPAIRSIADVSALEPPDIDSAPSIVYMRESIRRLVQDLGHEKPICGVITSPVDLPALILGIDLWIETLISDEPLAQDLLAMTSGYFVSYANALFRDGASFLAIPSLFTHPSILFPDHVHRIILPTLHRAFKAVSGPIVFHHGGNPLVPYLQKYMDLPNVAGFALDHRDDLDRARSILGPGRLILGNLNGPTLSSLPLDRILGRVDGILENRADDLRFIFLTAAADIPFNTPVETLKAIAERIRSWQRKGQT